MHFAPKLLMSTRGRSASRGRWLIPWLLLLPLGCQRSGPTVYEVEKPPEVSAAGRAAAAQFYQDRCAQCHGPAGAGDGTRATSVHPAPRRLTDRVWQANVTNVRLRKVLVQGGGAVNKSPVMPGYPELALQPETVDGLVALVRSFAAP